MNQVKLKKAELIEPSVIKYVDGTTYGYLTLNKEASKYIYSRLGMSPSVSRKIYNLDNDIWRDLIKMRFDSSETDIHDLSNYNYIINGSSIVAMTEMDLSQQMDKFDNFCEDISASYYVNDVGVLQLSTLTDIDDNFKSAVFVDMDILNGYYAMYSGVIYNDRIITIIKPIMETWTFEEFMSIVDIENEVSMSARMSENIKDLYDPGIADNMVMSVREVLEIIKRSKCDVTLDDDGFVSSIDGMSRESSIIITRFINSFKLPYKSLKKLGYLRKSLRYDSVTIDGMLEILSHEYFQSNGVNASMISELLKIYDSMESDRNVLQAEIRK